MKRILYIEENIPLLPILPDDVLLLIGEFITLPRNNGIDSELTDECVTLSRFRRVSKVFYELISPTEIWESWREAWCCKICRVKLGRFHSNCNTESEECKFPCNTDRLNALCRDCGISGECRWCGYVNCGCMELEKGCEKCSRLYCPYCLEDPNLFDPNREGEKICRACQ